MQPNLDTFIQSSPIQWFIQKVLSKGKTFIEWPSENGLASIHLANKGLDVKCVSYEQHLAGCAQNKDIHYIKGKGKIELIQVELDGDIVFDDKVDVLFCIDALQIFDDKLIIESIRKRMKYAKYIMFSVPSENFRSNKGGLSRLMSLKQWEKILEPLKDQLEGLVYHDRGFHIMGVIKCQKTQKKGPKKQPTQE